MIVTRLAGGLGNQMFQYAAGRALALRRGTELRLDLSGLDAPGARAYGLGAFRLTAPAAAAGDLPPARRSWADRLLGRPRRRLVEASLRFDPAVIAAPDGTCLDGYWQSERYFLDQDAPIRADFTLRAPPDEANAALLDRIAGTTGICVHVRRGDYAADPQVRAVHGTCGPDYYRAALGLLIDRLGGDLTAFVFSDDPDWTRAHIALPVPTVYVTHNAADRPHEDLRLMQACRHHVIANSTLSWWGAWLGEKPGTLAVAPTRWFASPDRDARDIVPERWLRI
ncbi:alpha-1,2-fucosyltransferase [Aquabacter spiritensis]|uniref:Glycosyl transferase family 11 n=1 Tax=Aquabacter spiritensis TaxID=933073 RepID=A0A4R3LTX9_9HYPH|nr:alpha-1,2-fucosyltransferase [Aquabacter spiritensis]TCT03964.1 glycosyl transferase family 11 [Aquabacter spiritensis]